MIGWGHNRQKPIKTSSLREYEGIILFKSNRYYCKDCRLTKSEINLFSYDIFRSSYQLIRSIFNYLGNLNYTLQMISDELNISTTQINKYIDSYIVIPPRDLPEWLGIDELHNPELSYKHSSYLCVLVDGQNRYVYDILGSRSKHYLNNHFMSFPLKQREKVKYVTIDLWKAYKDTAIKCFPNCIVTVDQFHYVKHLCDDFDDLRIHIMNQCQYGSNQYYLLKNWNWLLTSDNVELDNTPQYNSRFKTKLNRKDILNMIHKEYPILNEAYFLKEKFRHAVSMFDYETMHKSYDGFLEMFENSNIKEFDEFIKILQNLRGEIPNSFIRPYGDHKLSNALTENVNGKLDTYIEISHGISNLTRFRKRILYALNPTIFYSSANILKSNALKGKPRGKYKKIKE